MPTCFVRGCSNRQINKPEVTYHLIPKHLRAIWLCAIGRDPDTFVVQQRVCSEHFYEHDFERLGMLKRIKPNVIPTRNLPEPIKDESVTKARPRQAGQGTRRKTVFRNGLLNNLEHPRCVPNSARATNDLLIRNDYESAETYVLNQSELVSLPLKTSPSHSSMENVEEIVVNENQVHVLHNSESSEQVGFNVCRTCLASAPPSTHKKLFDMNDKGECDRLRDKIVYVAGNIDFNASVNPVVCSKCITIIDIAYGFKKKVVEVEARIEKKSYRINGINTMVNLRSLIGEQSVSDVAGVSDDAEKAVTIVNNSKSEVIIVTNNTPCNTTNENTKSLEEYLANREQVLKKFFSDLPIDKPRRVVNKQNDFRSFDIDCSDSEATTSGAGATPAKPSITINPNKTVVRLERRFSSPELFTNIRLRVKKVNNLPEKKWVVQKEDEAYRETPTPMIDRAPSVTGNNSGYQYLFANHRKVKPPVPGTFDLFDEAHDQYFRELEGNVGHRMASKWAGIGRRPPQMGAGPYLCELCGMCFEDRIKFRTHLYHHKYNLPQRMCSRCGRFFRGSQSLRNHIMSKHKPPSFQCKVCGKMFHLSTLLAVHVNAVHSDKKKRYQCHECGRLMSEKCLRIHKDIHSANTYDCDVCRKVFNTLFGMYKHRRKHFTRYACPFCGLDFSCNSSMRLHVKQLHEGWRWQCLICGTMLMRKAYIDRHTHAMHEGQTPRWKRRKIDADETSGGNDKGEA